MEGLKKHMLDCFQEFLNDEFQRYCSRHNLERSEELFLSFLIDRQLISSTRIHHYTVLHEFEKTDLKLRKSAIVQRLANRFNLSERTVWNILKALKNKDKA